MRSIWRVAAIAIVGIACTDIIPATREDAYDFHYEYGTLALAYQWPISAMPLHIWVDPAGPLYQPALTGIKRWENAVLYGEFHGVIVADSTNADIIIHNTPEDQESDIELNRRAPQCIGVTVPSLDPDAQTVTLPILIFIYPNGNQDPAALATCYRLTTTHELGHALGILTHSPNPADIMYRDPVVEDLSAADKETMEEVFHSIPNLTLIRGQCPITELCADLHTGGSLKARTVRQPNMPASWRPLPPHITAAIHLENR